MPNKYSPKEMHNILGRAIERSKEPAGVDHETLVEAASEVGISKEAVEVAARESVKRGAPLAPGRLERRNRRARSDRYRWCVPPAGARRAAL